MGEEEEKSSNIEGEHDTNMGPAIAEGLQSGIFKRGTEDSMEYLYIRQKDKCHISPNSSDNDCQTIQTIDGNVSQSVSSVSSVVSDSLRPHGLQHARLPCPSPPPGVYSNSCPLSRWCNPTISSSVIPFSSCLQSSPASASFQTSQLFTPGGQSTECKNTIKQIYSYFTSSLVDHLWN